MPEGKLTGDEDGSRLGEPCYKEAPNVEFGCLDRDAEVEVHHRNLPHWFQPGVAIFVTYRTDDSMPLDVVRRWERERKAWRDARARADRPNRNGERDYRRLSDRPWHDALDECHGACELRRPELAGIVGDALRYFDGVRYDLDSFVVMPNHVHLIVQFRHPYTLKRQTAGWTRYTAGEINRALGRSGVFWQGEVFDHLIRTPEQLGYLRKYIADNPRKARLKPGEYLYWSREHAK